MPFLRPEWDLRIFAYYDGQLTLTQRTVTTDLAKTVHGSMSVRENKRCPIYQKIYVVIKPNFFIVQLL